MNTMTRYVVFLVGILSVLLIQGCASTQAGKAAGAKVHVLYTEAVQSIPTAKECGLASPSDPRYVQCIRSGARSVAAIAEIANNTAVSNRAAVETETFGTQVNMNLVLRPLNALGRFGADSGGAHANWTINNRSEKYNESQEAIAKANANTSSKIYLPDGPLADSHDTFSLNNQQQQQQDQTAKGGNATGGTSYSNSNSESSSLSGAVSTSGAVANPVNIANGGLGGDGGDAYSHSDGGDCVNCGVPQMTTN